MAVVVTIPKDHYKKYLIYGIIFGGLGELALVLVTGRVFHQVEYINMGPFAFLGTVSFWTPISWTFAAMLFFYFMPTKRIFLYPYLLMFYLLGFGVGQVLQGFGLFRFIGMGKYIATLVYAAWFSLSAWYYLKHENICLE
ncbi:MAG: hypothetical protein ACYCX4_16110 [Bacillota bacterium]